MIWIMVPSHFDFHLTGFFKQNINNVNVSLVKCSLFFDAYIKTLRQPAGVHVYAGQPVRTCVLNKEGVSKLFLILCSICGLCNKFYFIRIS